MRIRVLTDDFTSAADGVVGFAERGWETEVLFSEKHETEMAVGSIDLDTRAAPLESSLDKVRAQAHAWSGADLLIKQFDSTLRGHVAEECLAALASSGRSRLLVVPAFPSAGRTTRHGKVHVHGVPVEQTMFRNDPLNPVTSGDFCGLFARVGMPLPCAANAKDAKDLLHQYPGVIVDAEREADLDAVVETFRTDHDLLWAGSTGIVRVLARALEPGPHRNTMIHHPAAHIAVVVGSRNEVSRLQLAALEQRGWNDVSLFATRSEPDDPGEASARLAASVAKAMTQETSVALVVTGGETLKHLALAMGAKSYWLLREIEPGIPLGILECPNGNFPVICKAGGFGTENTLINCVEALRCNPLL